MFQRFHAMRERKESGFTLIELLVVILIIAILAAIAIPVFLNQRKKGWVSQQQSALKNAATAMETYATEQNGSYSGATLGSLQALGYVTTTNVTLSVGTPSTQSYCLTATHSLLGADAWATATYDSNEGTPENNDTC
jgi:type IV pilus assembly protein PilA